MGFQGSVGRSVRSLWCAVAAGFSVAMAAHGGTFNYQATWATASGSKTADYRVYTPPAADVPRIRGVVFLYPGSGGDWRFRADDTVWQEAARSLGCALIGAGSNAGFISISEAEALASLDAILAAAAAVSGRPELVNAPVVFTGFSLGGFVSTEMAQYLADRVVAAVPQRGSNVIRANWAEAARQVPVLFIPGSDDTNGATDPNVTASNFRGWRADGGRAAYAVDWRTQHDTFTNQGWSLAWIWIAEAFRLRYPAGVLPGLVPGHPVTLNPIPLASGWLGQRPYVTSTTGADRSEYVAVSPYADYAGVVSNASWLLSETVARAYQAQTSYDGATTRSEIPLQGPLAIVGAAKPDSAIQSGQTNPPQMAVLPVGETFDIEVDPRGFGRAAVTLASQNLIANGDFAQWASGVPTSWTAGNTAGLSQGPDLGSAGGAAVIRETASLSQSFTPLAESFQLRFAFTVNLTPENSAWNQPLIVNLFQSNQAVNPASPWLTFRFTASNVSAGPFSLGIFTNNTGAVTLSGQTVAGSTYDFTSGVFTSGPLTYTFILNYFADSDTYAVAFGPSGGTLFHTGTLGYFRNPTNPSFGGISSVQFYSYVNGAALDDVRLSAIDDVTAPIQSMAYYDGDQLLGVQTEPGVGGWKLPHTLTTRGIHGLTVVATDAPGGKTSAYRAVVAAEAVPQGTTLYRFEPSPGFKNDSYDLLNLTSNATTGTGPQQVALEATGPGAAFPRAFDGTGGANDYAARFTASKGDVFTCADNPLLPSDTTPFTVEAFVNLASGGAGGTFRTIAAHGTGSTGSTLAWQLVVTGEGSGQGARRLVLQFCGSAAGALDTINSGFELQTGVDYYVAASIMPTNTSASGITFYFKDLSASGALQSSSRTHSQTSITNIAAAFAVGNRHDRGNGWDGLIDEFRLTTRVLSAGELLVNQLAEPAVPGSIAADDARISYSDYVRKSFVAAPFDASVTLARFDRLLTISGKGYEWDNPGARIRFRTDATNAQATLYYNDRHVSTSARNSWGFYKIDGMTNAAWVFQTAATSTVRAPEQVVVTLAVPPGGGFHDYELILPYGDAVDFQGLQVNAEAQFQTPAARPSKRYLAYGDSITHGFTASDTGGGYAYRVAEAKAWQLVNMGFGGRAATAADGTTVGSLQADVVSVLIGVNDWQGGVALATYSNRLDGFLTNLRAQQPSVPVFLLTPLWVHESWNPGSQIAPLESYREIVRAVAAARNDPYLTVIEGPELIDPSTDYFDAVLVHPNDAGFAMMAERLVALMEPEPPVLTVKTWLGGASANWADAATWTPTGVPQTTDAVSVSNAATATLTVQSGVAAVAAALSFDNASGKTASLAIADGGSLAVAGAITDPGAGAANISVVNSTPGNAASVLTAASLTANQLALSSSSADQYLDAGFDVTLAAQLQLGIGGGINRNITYRQTGGTMTIPNSAYGLCLLEAYDRPTAGTQTYVLDGGTLKADRIGVANGNGCNTLQSGYQIDRWAGRGVLAFNNGTIETRAANNNVWLENGSAFEDYDGTASTVRDMQRNTSRPLTVTLAQDGTRTFNASFADSAIVVSPSARLTDKAGAAGSLVKTGPGRLTFTGGGLAATNDWTGDTTVLQGAVRVDYNLIAGAPGSLALADAYSPQSRLVLSGGGFELVGRASAAGGSAGGVTVPSGGGWIDNYKMNVPSTAGLAVGQTVGNAFLPAGTYIRRILSGTQIELSHKSTSEAGETGQTVTFGALAAPCAQTVNEVYLAAPASVVSVTPGGAETTLAFGNVSGPGGLVKSGTGALRLTGSVTHGGTNTISAGTLDFAGAGLTLLTNAVTGSGTFRHSGGGTTVVDAAAASINTFSGPVVVDGGALQHGTANANQRRGLSNASSYTVNAGATMIATRDSMRDGVPYNLNGGTLKMLKGFQYLGTLTLNGGALATGPGQGGPYQAFALGGNVAVTGNVPSVIRAEPGTHNGVHLAFNAAAGVLRTFRVEDVTGDAAADLTVSAALLESSHTGNSAGLIKTGAGTMALVGATNIYSGATVVSNGTLLVSGGGMTNSAVAVVSGAAFGVADATATPRVASLSFQEGARAVWRYDGEERTAGRIDVTGVLTLPAAATLEIGGTGFLYSGQKVFSAGGLAGASALDGWTVTGTPDPAKLRIVGNDVVLMLYRGTQIRMR